MNIYEQDKIFFNKEKKYINNQLKGFKKEYENLLIQANQFYKPNYRAFNRNLQNKKCIKNFLHKFNVSLKQYDNIKHCITKKEKIKIAKQFCYQNLQEQLLKKKRNKIKNKQIFDFLPDNCSIEIKNNKFNTIRQHFQLYKNSVRNKMKTAMLLQQQFDDIYIKVMKDFNSKNTNLKILATMAIITMETGMRPGTKIGKSNKQNKDITTYGLTNLKKSHIKIEQDNIIFKFIGKMGSKNIYKMKNKAIATFLFALKSNEYTPLFKTKNNNVKYNDFLTYLNQFGFTPSNFRKRIANINYFNALKLQNNKNKLVNVNNALKIAAKALNHETETKVVINAYCNPVITIKYVAEGIKNNLTEMMDDNLFKCKI